MKSRKMHYINGQKNGTTVTACGLIAGKDGVVHVPQSKANCKNCKRNKNK